MSILPQTKRGKTRAPLYSGRFITFEGGEGAGKSTLLRLLAGELKKRGYPVLLTREPGGTRVGRAIRVLLEKKGGEIVPEAELLLFLSDRAQHVEEVILPRLSQGYHILCDRYHDSTLAYQGYGRGLPVEEVSRFFRFSSLLPDRTYLLDLPPGEGLNRVKKRGGGDRNRLTPIEREEVEFHRRVREGYLELAQRFPERFIVLDARATPRELLSQVLESYPFSSV